MEKTDHLKRARPATSAGKVSKEMTEEKARPSSAFNPMSFFGGGKDKKEKNKKKKQKFVPPAIDNLRQIGGSAEQPQSKRLLMKSKEEEAAQVARLWLESVFCGLQLSSKLV